MPIHGYPGGVISADPNTPTVTSASGTWTLEEAYQNIGNWPMAQSQIQNSLRFNSADSSYLSRTPSVASNRKTWTWSGWVKRSALSSTYPLFMAGSAGTDYTILAFNSNDVLYIANIASSANAGRKFSSAVYRDVSAWYHVVAVFDTDNATANDRMILYVNGSRITALSVDENPSSGQAGQVNNNVIHTIGRNSTNTVQYFNGYLTEVNFIDGLALDADYFGFTDANGIWQPKPYKGAYGTNGFYLPMTLSATATGFSTVTYDGTATTNKVTGVGFAPDFVWIKNRSAGTFGHRLVDIVRGATKELYSNSTSDEGTEPAGLISFDPDGFTVGSNGAYNYNTDNIVAWCWDAGSSTVTNNDGTITSTVRASQANGVSVVTWTNASNGDATVGHGLGAAPKLIITKKRSTTNDWYTFTTAIDSSYDYLKLNATDAKVDSAKAAPTSTVFTTDMGDTSTAVAYCFSEISGFSKIGTYSGSGASGNTVTLGFKPAFVMIKRTDTTGGWSMFDSVRTGPNSLTNRLVANTSDAEIVETTDNYITITSTGFSVNGNGGITNASGGTYLYIAFADTRAFDPFDDYSGNGNNWQPNNIGTDDVFTDVPTNQGTDTGVGGEVRGNYATLNPVGQSSSLTVSNGNLSVTSSTATWYSTSSTIAIPSSGKWYCEFLINTLGPGPSIGIFKVTDFNTATIVGYSATSYSLNTYNGNKANNSSSVSYGSGLIAGDILNIAVDMDSGKIWWGKNGTWFASGAPASGTNEAYSGLSGEYYVSASIYSGVSVTANFGQLPFAYTAPSGFKALCTQNLPTPTILDGADYFQAVPYQGNASTQTISVGFQPDFVWIKGRSFAGPHNLFDAVRGATKVLYSNLTNAEATNVNTLTAFTSNGFSLGNDGDVNRSADGGSLVAWNWKASNAAGVTNTAGTITSTVSANTTAGFSIVTYTGTGSAATIGHGLGATPSAIITKKRSGGTADAWFSHFSAAGTGTFFKLNTTDAVGTNATVYPWDLNSTTFGVSNDKACNESGSTYVAYCFAPVAGYSAFGSYTGNGSTDGPFVYTGFRPRWIMFKRTDAAASWVILDSARLGYNQENALLYANLSNAEDSTIYHDILSNGFKPRTTTGNSNTSGGTYIYAAFAENPFKLSRAR